VKQVILDRPFSAGMVTDSPDYAVGPQNSVFAQDGYSPSGVFVQRKGWAYDGAGTVVAATLKGVYRVAFALSDVTRTVCVTTNSFYLHNGGSGGTLISSSGATILPRAVYRDELLLCSQDGLTPLMRYSGAASGAITLSGTQSFTQYTANVVFAGGGSFSASPGVGAYFRPAWSNSYTGIARWHRIVESSTSSATMEDGISNTGSGALISSGSIVSNVGYAFPCVGIYNAGTVTYDNAALAITGSGTKWESGSLTIIEADPRTNASDAILVTPTGADANLFEFRLVGSDTFIQLVRGGTSADITTGSNYQILRRMPFKDVAVHRESLWGTGNAYFPNRVYVGPPGWNIANPPGEQPPYNISRFDISENANDFLMDYIDVPAPFDGDHNVAILSSPGPLLVLKRKAVYGISGSYGGLSVDMVADGIGCIDIRSAQSYDEGQVWAGEGGIYWYAGGQIVDLTAGKMNREWRELIRDFDYGTSDYCSIGMASNHLVVHLTTGGGTTQRTYLCDMRDRSWQSRVTNTNARYFFTSRIPGEKEKLLFTSDDNQGRVMDFAPAVDGSGIAKDGDGDSPRMKAWTGKFGGLPLVTRLVEVAVHTNLYDASPAATELDVSTYSEGGIGNDDGAERTHTAISSDAIDQIDRNSRFRPRTKGRYHQIRLDASTTGTNTDATKIEVHMIEAYMRDWRKRA
jgi:hypothetical protein